MNSIPQGPDLVLDELPGGTGQLVHAPDAGQVFAVNALGGPSSGWWKMSFQMLSTAALTSSVLEPK